MEKYIVELTSEERKELSELVSKGKAAARKVTNARVLLEADESEGGPATATGDPRKSKLLVSDFFGYGQRQSRSAFGSCEEFKDSSVADETRLLSAYCSCEGDINSKIPELTLSAGYTDGHVESYSSQDALALRVSKTSD